MGIPSRRPRMGHEARTFFSIPVGSGTRRYKIGAIAVPHLIEQPCLEAEGGPVLAREFQVNDFPNIQIGIGLETDADLYFGEIVDMEFPRQYRAPFRFQARL